MKIMTQDGSCHEVANSGTDSFGGKYIATTCKRYFLKSKTAKAPAAAEPCDVCLGKIIPRQSLEMFGDVLEACKVA